MRGLTYRYTFFLLLGAPLVASAEQVVIPIGQTTTEAIGAMPQRGETKAAVSSRFGPAQKSSAAVGSPPIERWDYPTFSVYFEQDQVLHAVLQRTPEQG